MAVDSFRTNRINKLKEFDELLEVYCNGIESEIDKVKRKTDEEFHFWLEKKIKSARRMEAQAKKLKTKRGN